MAGEIDDELIDVARFDDFLDGFLDVADVDQTIVFIRENFGNVNLLGASPFLHSARAFRRHFERWHTAHSINAYEYGDAFHPVRSFIASSLLQNGLLPRLQ
jgi:hypothetical protein